MGRRRRELGSWGVVWNEMRVERVGEATTRTRAHGHAKKRAQRLSGRAPVERAKPNNEAPRRTAICDVLFVNLLIYYSFFIIYSLIYSFIGSMHLFLCVRRRVRVCTSGRRTHRRSGAAHAKTRRRASSSAANYSVLVSTLRGVVPRCTAPKRTLWPSTISWLSRRLAALF